MIIEKKRKKDTFFLPVIERQKARPDPPIPGVNSQQAVEKVPS
ncbi:MAG TPA: hypothetical protein VMW91_06320 [Desulfosporosinus sp.]|nr:hypothetical protein [Desulfosporosinus sp.]